MNRSQGLQEQTCRHKTKNCCFSFPPIPALSFQSLSDRMWWGRLTEWLASPVPLLNPPRVGGGWRNPFLVSNSIRKSPYKQTLNTSSKAGFFSSQMSNYNGTMSQNKQAGMINIRGKKKKKYFLKIILWFLLMFLPSLQFRPSQSACCDSAFQ